MNNGIMKKIIEMINEETKGKRACLLLDQHPSHCSDYIKEYSKKKKVKLIYVPKGYTYKYQPLDVGINCIIKVKSKERKGEKREEKIKNLSKLDLKITNEDAYNKVFVFYGSIRRNNIRKYTKIIRKIIPILGVEN